MLLVAFLSAITARGQDEAAAFVHDFQHDPAEEGLASFLTIVLVVAVATVLYSLLSPA